LKSLEYRTLKKIEIDRRIRMNIPRISISVLYNLFSIEQCSRQLENLKKHGIESLVSEKTSKFLGNPLAGAPHSQTAVQYQ